MKSQTQFRQGDVLITRVNTIPDGAKALKREGDVILAHGEVTGHAHRIKERRAEMFDGGGGGMFLNLPVTSDLTHEEHSTITIPAGGYRITRQREYDDVQEWVQVAD